MFGCWRKRKKRKIDAERKKPKKPYVPDGDKAVFIDGEIVDIQIHSLHGFTSKQKSFFLEAMHLQCRVLNSQEFKQKFLAMKCKETKGYSQKQLYDMLISGVDAASKVADNDIDFIYSLYGNKDQRSKTIGYTYKSKIKVWTHRWHVAKWMRRKYGTAYFAGHAFHEYLHSMGRKGFGHKKVKRKSFVYMGGRLMRDLCKDVINGRQLTKVKK